MFSLAPGSKVRGAAHIVLNIIRGCNVITLLSLAVASWVMIIKSNITTGYFFFQAFAHCATSFFALFLVFSECNLFSKYIEKTWPVLGPNHSFAWLGTALIVMGAQVLGSLNAGQDYIDHLTLPLWRLTLAAGILAMIFGSFNLIASVIFRNPSEQLTARMLRADGALAKSGFSAKTMYDYESNRAPSPAAANRKTFLGGFLNGNRKSKVQIGQPQPIHHDEEAAYPEEPPFPAEPSAASVGRDSLVSRDSRFDRSSPVLPALQRPPTAQHPMFARSASRNASSRYSAATMSSKGMYF